MHLFILYHFYHFPYGFIIFYHCFWTSQIADHLIHCWLIIDWKHLIIVCFFSSILTIHLILPPSLPIPYWNHHLSYYSHHRYNHIYSILFISLLSNLTIFCYFYFLSYSLYVHYCPIMLLYFIYSLASSPFL